MNNDNGLRELSVEEVNQVAGGFVLDLSSIAKVNIDLGSTVDTVVTDLASLLGLQTFIHS